MFWLSHVVTLIGGLGALFRSRFVMSVAMASLFGHHALWRIDIMLLG
jgi:hypothetical protein